MVDRCELGLGKPLVLHPFLGAGRVGLGLGLGLEATSNKMNGQSFP